MSVRPILLLGDARLRLKGRPVDSFGKYLHELLDDLTHTMRAAPGVGLAAPQLGEAVNACVIELEGKLHELVNPHIVKTSGDDRDLEGCLSIPGYAAYVTRRERVWVVAQNRQGRKYRIAGSGLLGRALQHELDHLDGKLYIDYLESLDELIAVGQGEDQDEDDAESTDQLRHHDWRSQAVNATASANFSEGDIQPSVCRGRPLSSAATASSWS